ncbi:hypothetical protein M378DRAFT_594375 [Amanita muscaria Koide BX008]|uniref:Uncharacterized protein n=1 Tax=Amanita muscaria (strain Koide BX008) TaxID=946122 RepID=A0A0C2TC06_AMAMK|nr:hypothetical protein M378DRAFT_594375 [Amanita muscaria Koide BX008]
MNGRVGGCNLHIFHRQKILQWPGGHILLSHLLRPATSVLFGITQYHARLRHGTSFLPIIAELRKYVHWSHAVPNHLPLNMVECQATCECLLVALLYLGSSVLIWLDLVGDVDVSQEGSEENLKEAFSLRRGCLIEVWLCLSYCPPQVYSLHHHY